MMVHGRVELRCSWVVVVYWIVMYVLGGYMLMFNRSIIDKMGLIRMSDIVVDHMVRRMAIDDGIVHLPDISKAYIVLRPAHLSANCDRDWYA